VTNRPPLFACSLQYVACGGTTDARSVSASDRPPATSRRRARYPRALLDAKVIDGHLPAGTQIKLQHDRLMRRVVGNEAAPRESSVTANETSGMASCEGAGTVRPGEQLQLERERPAH